MDAGASRQEEDDREGGGARTAGGGSLLHGPHERQGREEEGQIAGINLCHDSSSDKQRDNIYLYILN